MRGVESPLCRALGSGGRKRLPRTDLLIYLARPNSDEYLVGEDTEIGEDTYIWGYILPDDSDVRDATGWVTGTANVFYDAAGVPVVVLATEINRAILPLNVIWHLTSETQQTGRLAVYDPAAISATIDKARSVLRDDSIDHLFFGNTGIWYDPQDLTTMFQGAAGTLPVYRPGSGAIDPPVGLMLDKGQGLELGPELVTNGTFDINTSGWVSYTANTTLSWSSGEAVATRNSTPAVDAALCATPISIDVAPGNTRRYQVSFDCYSPVYTGLVRVSIVNSNLAGPGAASMQIPAVKTRLSCIVAVDATATPTLLFSAGGTAINIGESVYFDNISIREIKGYHAYQTTTTARPTLSGRYNLLTATETLSTQSVTTAATDYTLRFEGTGTITLSGTATGTYSAGTHTIPCTAGALTCTIAGSVTKADLRVKRDGSSLPAYQSVTNANTYDTAGFPLFLKRDRVDDDLIVKAPAITGQTVWGSINTVDIAAATIAAGAYNPFGTINTGEPTCTQWIAIDGELTAAEQVVLERYVYSKSKLQVGV